MVPKHRAEGHLVQPSSRRLCWPSLWRQWTCQMSLGMARDSSTLMNHMCIIQGVFKQKHLSHRFTRFFFLSIYLFLLQHLVFNAASKGSFVAVCECLVEACEASWGTWTLSCINSLWGLVPWWGIKPQCTAWGGQSLSHWVIRKTFFFFFQSW